MARFKNVNGDVVAYTAEEEAEAEQQQQPKMQADVEKVFKTEVAELATVVVASARSE